MTKRPASSSLDGLRGSRARNGDAQDDSADELPSWFETFVKSNDDRDRLMKVRTWNTLSICGVESKTEPKVIGNNP